ncbi:MAG: imelysin family protein [Flavobacteriaceae bacterium]
MRKSKKYIIYLFLITLVLSCTKDDSGNNENEIVQETVADQKEEINSSASDSLSNQNQTTSSETTYNRSSFLINVADNILIPSHNQFKTDLIELQGASNAFEEETNDSNLKFLREKWIASYKSWQHIEMYDIGRAEEIYFKSKMNIYPVNIDRLENNVSTGSYDLNNANNFSSQGFPALDYLLYGIGSSDSEIVDKFSSGSGYKTYLKDIILKMVANTNEVIDSWVSYRDVFVNSTENTATSSINKLTNDFIYYYEKGFRANKIGIPAGVFSNDVLPDRVEAYYSKIYSKDLALEAMTAIDNFFQGKYFNSDETGDSLKTYLNFLDVIKNESNLSTLITEKFSSAKTSIESLDDNFALQLEQDYVKVLGTYDAVQLGVVLLKVDMLQALSINVDYADADGD